MEQATWLVSMQDFLKESPRALYNYDLNLAFCQACDVNEIHLMLDTLKQLRLFFKYSPKRSRQVEVGVDEVNQKKVQIRPNIKNEI